MTISYRQLRAALEDSGIFQYIKDKTSKNAVLTVSTGAVLNDPGIVDPIWLDPGAYLAIRLDTVEDVEKLAELIIQPMTTLRQRVLAVAAEVAELDGLDEEVAKYYASLAGAVAAHIDYEATREESEKLQEEIDRLQERQRALAVGVYMRDRGWE